MASAEADTKAKGEEARLAIEVESKARKQHMLKIMRRDQKMLENRARFIEEVCADDLIVSNRKRTEILADLRERKYEYK